MDNEIQSPINSKAIAVKEVEIDLGWLVAENKRLFNIDISYLIPVGCKKIYQYKCLASGYKFYGPKPIVGDTNYYEKLQEVSWYYTKDKWEFREALRHIANDSAVNVLEIGAAKGFFLRNLMQHNPLSHCVGLELNENAAKEANASGLDVLIQSTSDHAKVKSNFYDAIVSFQVLEHVPNPMDMISDACDMLKMGGKLIICVPNNSGSANKSIFDNENNILNMPPHHQGLWDIPSLAYITHLFPLRLDSIVLEAATSIPHQNSYRGQIKNALITKYGKTFGMCFYVAGRLFFNVALKELSKHLPAHSVMAVYIKQ